MIDNFPHILENFYMQTFWQQFMPFLHDFSINLNNFFSFQITFTTQVPGFLQNLKTENYYFFVSSLDEFAHCLPTTTLHSTKKKTKINLNNFKPDATRRKKTIFSKCFSHLSQIYVLRFLFRKFVLSTDTPEMFFKIFAIFRHSNWIFQKTKKNSST